MNHYEAKQEARRARLEDRADRASTEANRRFRAARTIMDGIPMGQPILVGHHSEKHHRRDIARIDTNIGKGIEAQKKAASLASRAAAVGTGGISADDPEAVQKLGDKRTDLERRRDGMKAFNVAWRKAGRPKIGPEFTEAWKGLAAEFPSLWREGLRTLELAPYHDAPFPAYALTNIGARIRQATARVGTLEREGIAESIEGPEGDGWKVFDDELENRVGIYFDGKPAAAIRTLCKGAGLRWCPSEGRWQRHRNNAGRYAVRDLAFRLAGL